AEALGGAGGVAHVLSGTFANAFGITVAPHAVGQDPAMALVDRVVAHRLADEMIADRPAAQAVRFELGALALAVVGLGQRAVDLEVVAPARELAPVDSPPRRH